MDDKVRDSHQRCAKEIEVLLAPHFNGRHRVPRGIPYLGAVALGGKPPWYADAKIEPEDAEPKSGEHRFWAGEVILIEDDLMVRIARARDGEGYAEPSISVRRFAPVGLRIVNAAWESLPDRLPEDSQVEFKFGDGEKVLLPFAVGLEDRFVGNGVALFEKLGAILERLAKLGV